MFTEGHFGPERVTLTRRLPTLLAVCKAEHLHCPLKPPRGLKSAEDNAPSGRGSMPNVAFADGVASDLDLLKGELSRVRCSPDRTVMSRTWSV